MQASLRNGALVLRPLAYRAQLFSARTHIHSRQYATFNPLSWVKEVMAPGTTAQPSEEDVVAARQEAIKQGRSSVFEVAASPEAANESKKKKKGKKKKSEAPSEHIHKYSTSHFKISHRKLNMLGRQISGKPIDYAILQMQFSEKRASSRILNMLATAKDHAQRYKRLRPERLVVSEAWVTKGVKAGKKLEPRGRGHFGIRIRPTSRMHVVLKEGKTLEQRKAEDKERKLRRIVSASLVREDKPIRNPAPTWGW
ncbi:ribosomal protein L22/L17 [Cyathus striatus]|nr:ribosomal protein L22/L17 [Cyathus striatus]